MCATGMELGDEELVWLSNRNPTDAPSVASVMASATSPAASLAAAGGFRETQHSFSSSERSARLGLCSPQPYSDSSSGPKPNNMPLQTLNAFQGQVGQSSFPSPTMLPKNGVRRQGLWSPPSNQRNFGNGRSVEIETEQRLVDYPSALLDQSPTPMPDPFRASTGLARYHSAPSSFLAGLADLHQDGALGSFFSDDLPPSLESMETEQGATSLFDDKFILSTRKFERGNPQLGGAGGVLVAPKAMQSLYKPSMEVVHENLSGHQMPSSTQMLSSSQMSGMGLPSSLGMQSSLGLTQQSSPQTAQQISLGSLGNLNYSCDLDSNFGGVSTGSMGGNRANGNLLRQSSSPAGLLAQLSIDVQPQLKNEKQSLSSPLAHSPEDSLSGGTSEENAAATPGMGAWEDVANSYMNWANDSSARKRFRENMDLGDVVLPSEISGRPSLEHGPVAGGLIRHMSLPTPKSKSSVLPEDILQSVPCRIRAKRGCATHPRSIAERVRRTKISERMRKLQELVPNMDKAQTNTADMLDEAVEYVKQLQRQVQELTESQAKCNGSCHQDHKKSMS